MKIALCGSARFETEFKKWNRRLSLAGHVVYSLAVYPSDVGGKDWYTPQQKLMLDEVHRKKIEESDGIVVVGDGYVGESTIREIVHAVKLEKKLFATSHALRMNPIIKGYLFTVVCPFAGCVDPLVTPPPCALCYE